MGNIGATPMPPPMHTAWPKRSIWVGFPRGPSTASMESPALEVGQLVRADADGLENKRDGATVGIGVGYRQGNALAPFDIGLHDDELPGLAFSRNMGSLDLDAEYLVGQAGLRYYLVHRSSSVCSTI